jgi:hypothetical protein
MYIMHAANFASGEPYADTGYIYNQHLPDLGPRRYPPVFPALLAPIYASFGLDLRAMKIQQIFFLIGFLALLPFACRSIGTFVDHSAVMLLVGLNPLVREQADMILSDILFCVVLYLAVLVSERRNSALAAGILIWLAAGVRVVGLLLIPAILLFDLVRLRRLTQFSIVATVSGVALAVVQAAILGGEPSYADYLTLRPPVVENLRLYASTMGDVFANGSSRAVALLLGGIVSVLAAAGFWLTWRREMQLWHVFAVLYVATLLAWPANQGFRYLLPLLPLYFYFALAGAKAVLKHVPSPAPAAVLAALGIVVLGSYVGVYARTDFGQVGNGVGMPEFANLCRYFQTRTDARDAILFRKPRALALFAGRRASAYHQPVDFAELWIYLHSIGARHVVVSNIFGEDRAYLARFVEHYQDRLEPVYQNDRFRVYRVRG